MGGDFEWPSWYSYPPYFTLQPVAETRAKQSALWRDLALAYGAAQKAFILATDDDSPLWANPAIDRRLPPDARSAFLADAIAAGAAAWIDGGGNRRALLLWRSLESWADALAAWARAGGRAGDVLTLDELVTGEELAGTDLEGAPRELVLAAARTLEARGRAAVFGAGDDLGVKFL